jgi:hypothetical protein
MLSDWFLRNETKTGIEAIRRDTDINGITVISVNTGMILSVMNPIGAIADAINIKDNACLRRRLISDSSHHLICMTKTAIRSTESSANNVYIMTLLW